VVTRSYSSADGLRSSSSPRLNNVIDFDLCIRINIMYITKGVRSRKYLVY